MPSFQLMGILSLICQLQNLAYTLNSEDCICEIQSQFMGQFAQQRCVLNWNKTLGTLEKNNNDHGNI